jgi:competence protein ComEC
MRDRVAERLSPADPGRGLLAGVLIGDTDGVDPIDQDAMRRSGLSHFTAVSGSNVALFLTVLFILLGPLGVGPRRRAVVGLLALPVFAAATRFEPSVSRASVMAGLVLGGRLVGIAMERWQILSTAIIGLLLLDPSLGSSVGFQLSVAATAGVMIGAKWPMDRGNRLGRALAVTFGAQVAVAPILIAHFGSVPLLSPLANLIAAPIVTASTVLGVIGTIGPVWFVTLAAGLAEAVLALARVAAGWPQVGWPTLATVLAAVWMAVRWPRMRSPAAMTGAALVAVMLIGGGDTLPIPGVVVLDVGQGDAILVAGGDDQYALVDGGPDPVVLIDSLRRYGVSRLRLVVLTHSHADHAAGLTGLAGRVPITAVWADIEPHGTPDTIALIDRLEASGVVVTRPKAGDRITLGRLALTVEGPLRRYASPNDQSVVLTVNGPARSMLLTGDIEEVAQAELGHLQADVLKVPHHGSATSDPDWLTAVGADLSVISVGPNDFGHPAPEVLETLVDAGDVVLRTDLIGDVAVPLG